MSEARKHTIKNTIGIFFALLVSITTVDVVDAQQGVYPAQGRELVFNPLTVDRFGVGAIGFPYSYGYGSAGQLGLSSVFGGYTGGPRLNDFLGAYQPRLDIEQQHARNIIDTLRESLDRAIASEANLEAMKISGINEQQRFNSIINLYNTAVSSTNLQTPQTSVDPLRDEVDTILRTHCYECHSGNRSDGGINLESFFLLGCKEATEYIGTTRRVDKPELRRMPKNRNPLTQSEQDVLDRYLSRLCNVNVPGPSPTPAPSNPTTPNQPNVDLSAYVTKTELEDALNQTITQITKPLADTLANQLGDIEKRLNERIDNLETNPTAPTESEADKFAEKFRRQVLLNTVDAPEFEMVNQRAAALRRQGYPIIITTQVLRNVKTLNGLPNALQVFSNQQYKGAEEVLEFLNGLAP